MGQPVVVTQKQSSRPGVVRYELNRTLTGTGHEIYRPGVEISGARPPDELARRLFDGVRGVESIHINGSVVTVEMSFGSDAGAAKGIIEDLYTYYRPGVEPPSFDTPAPAE
ncbi:MAG: hypothetical protein KDB24_13575 [Microthrixaceae bacterium]|nr:hypothetical protein [Microthrixaceae bacterium]